MTRTCAWCNKKFTPQTRPGLPDSRMTPPLCPACSELMVFQMGVPFQTFIDRLPAPIFVVNDNAEVQAANKLGLQFLNKESRQVLKKLGGEVFECAYARLPEGCGKTVHCSGCTIRRTVYETFDTGESRTDIPATLHYAGPGETEDIALRISTEKMGDVVLLKVEKAGAPVALR